MRKTYIEVVKCNKDFKAENLVCLNCSYFKPCEKIAASKEEVYLINNLTLKGESQ